MSEIQRSRGMLRCWMSLLRGGGDKSKSLFEGKFFREKKKRGRKNERWDKNWRVDGTFISSSSLSEHFSLFTQSKSFSRRARNPFFYFLTDFLSSLLLIQIFLTYYWISSCSVSWKNSLKSHFSKSLIGNDLKRVQIEVSVSQSISPLNSHHCCLHSFPLSAPISFHFTEFLSHCWCEWVCFSHDFLLSFDTSSSPISFPIFLVVFVSPQKWVFVRIYPFIHIPHTDPKTKNTVMMLKAFSFFSFFIMKILISQWFSNIVRDRSEIYRNFSSNNFCQMITIRMMLSIGSYRILWDIILKFELSSNRWKLLIS